MACSSRPEDFVQRLEDGYFRSLDQRKKRNRPFEILTSFDGSVALSRATGGTEVSMQNTGVVVSGCSQHGRLLSSVHACVSDARGHRPYGRRSLRPAGHFQGRHQHRARDLTTVTDSQGRLVPNLEQDEFTILDNGKRQPISFFQNETQPFTVVVMLDFSASMTANLDLLKLAAEQFLLRMLPQDKGQVGRSATRYSSAGGSRAIATI